MLKYLPIGAALFLLLLTVGMSDSPAYAQSRPERVTIIEVDVEPVTESWRFSPATITVQTGSRITWVNTGKSYHTITSPEGLFDSGYLSSGSSWSYDFDSPGMYDYFCVPYPWMKGTIIVRDAPSRT